MIELMRRFPPRLTATQLFWTGVALVVGALAVAVIEIAAFGYQGWPSLGIASSIATLVTLARDVGIGLVVISFAVRALRDSD